MNAQLQIEPITEKQAYGEALLRRVDNDPYLAALDVYPGDIPKALIVSREWPGDPEVKAVRDEYSAEELDELGTPTDNDLIREAWRRVLACSSHELAFKGIDTIGKLKHKGGAGTTINNNTLVDNRSVMIVKDHGTDAEWEAKLQAQQARLVNEAT